MLGLFLCLDGVDGSGKSTQLRLLSSHLRSLGHHLTLCRDPGDTPIGNQIRTLLLDSRSQMHPTCEMLLYQASRAQLVDDIIRPALDRNETVLSDRYLLSTVVYQGHAGGIPIDHILAVGQIATRNILPHWTGVLDIDLDRAAERRQQDADRTGADRIELRPTEFHRKVRAGFLAEANKHPDRISIINADQDPEAVFADIQREVSRVLDAAGRP